MPTVVELVVLADVLVRVVAAAPAMVVVTRAITSNGFIAAVDDFVVPCGLKAAHCFFSRIGCVGRHQPHTGEKMVVIAASAARLCGPEPS